MKPRRVRLVYIVILAVAASGFLLRYLLYSSHRRVEERQFALVTEMAAESPFTGVRGLLTGSETTSTSWDLSHEAWSLIGHWGPEDSYSFEGQLQIGDRVFPVSTNGYRPRHVVACGDDIWVISRTNDHLIEMIVAVIDSGELRVTPFKLLDDRKYLLKFSDSSITMAYRYALIMESVHASDWEQVACGIEAFVSTEPRWLFNFRVTRDAEDELALGMIRAISDHAGDIGLTPRIRDRIVAALATSVSHMRPTDIFGCAFSVATAIRRMDPKMARQLKDEVATKLQANPNDALFWDEISNALGR